MNALPVSDADAQLAAGVQRRDDEPVVRHQHTRAQRLVFG
jgi:hypothetical protein